MGLERAAALAQPPPKHDIVVVSPASTAKVVIYTTSYCGFCHAAKRLLGAKSVDYEEIAVDSRPDLRKWLVQASGQSTVPQVFINGESIGGYTETSQLESSGELDRLLAVAPSVDNPALRS